MPLPLTRALVTVTSRTVLVAIIQTQTGLLDLKNVAICQVAKNKLS